MAKQQINIKDFDLFCDVLKSAVKIVESAKFIVNSAGLEIYGMRMSAKSRCEIISDAISSSNELSFSVENLQLCLKIVSSVKDVHGGDYSGMKFLVDMPFIRFESKKFKTKFATCDENVISQWVSKKVMADMTPVFEFTGNSDMIKRLNSHSFMFSNPKDVRVYIETKDDMENNAVFATLGNKETDLNNEITLKLGLVTSGSLVERDENDLVVSERSIIIDLERLNLFNAVQSDNIKFSLMNLNCLVGKVSVSGKDDSFFNLTIYSSILKN